MQRTAPHWFSLKKYQESEKYTCQEWFHALKRRRNSKSLYDLIQAEPAIFSRKYDPDHFWMEYMHSLELTMDTTEINSSFSFHQPPKKLNQYFVFRILPLFDLTHWHEIHHQSLPSIEELEIWVFPDVNENIRYHVNDAKKLLRRALLECDALMYNDIKD